MVRGISSHPRNARHGDHRSDRPVNRLTTVGLNIVLRHSAQYIARHVVNTMTSYTRYTRMGGRRVCGRWRKQKGERRQRAGGEENCFPTSNLTWRSPLQYNASPFCARTIPLFAPRPLSHPGCSALPTASYHTTNYRSGGSTFLPRRPACWRGYLPIRHVPCTQYGRRTGSGCVAHVYTCNANARYHHTFYC